MNLKQIRFTRSSDRRIQLCRFFCLSIYGFKFVGLNLIILTGTESCYQDCDDEDSLLHTKYKRIDEAAAVCCRRNGRMLFNKYGPGSGTIWLDGVNCTGSETSIADCRHNGWGVNDCEHRDDVSISCVKLQSPPPPSSKNSHSSNSSVERWAGKKT